VVWNDYHINVACSLFVGLTFFFYFNQLTNLNSIKFHIVLLKKTYCSQAVFQKKTPLSVVCINVYKDTVHMSKICHLAVIIHTSTFEALFVFSSLCYVFRLICVSYVLSCAVRGSCTYSALSFLKS